MPEPSVQPRPETLALLKRASELEARGAWSGAIVAWSSAAAAHPSFLPAQLGLAKAQMRAGKPADALPALGRICAEAPSLPGVWLALAVANSMLGRHDDAIAAAGRAVAAALRWAHARLISHRLDFGPGQLRIANYLSVAFPGIIRIDPRRAQATIDAAVLSLAPRLPAGPVRIAFLRFALVLMQPFADGNTRAACFLQNRLLERAGFYPSLRPADDGRVLLEVIRDTADLEPLVASLAAGSHEASALDRANR